LDYLFVSNYFLKRFGIGNVEAGKRPKDFIGVGRIFGYGKKQSIIHPC